MNTKIFVMTHKRFHPPALEGYVPLHVGRALGQDYGYPGDDTGDNISELNPFYGELTGHYWLWKNCTDADIIGTCHYRRYFWDENRQPLAAEAFAELLRDSDVIVTNRIHKDVTYREDFGKSHNIRDMELTGEVLRRLYPQDYPYFEEVMNGHEQYYANMLVAPKPLFDDYCAWMFSIFAEVGERVDLSGYDDYHKRLFGFLSENLIMVYGRARGLKLKEVQAGLTAEKAETVEFKLALAQLVKLGQFAEARQLFYDYLKIRPDVELSPSDIRGEIPYIERIIAQLDEERKAKKTGLYEVSHDLFELVAYVREQERQSNG